MNKISTETAKKYIELEAHTEECKMFAKQAKFLENMDIIDMIEQYSKTPEEVVLEKEKVEDIENVLREIKEILTPEEFDIIWMYAVDGMSQENIAKKYDINRSTISRKCDSITKKCTECFQNRRTFIEDIFIPPQSKLTAHSPTVRGYPFELLQQVFCNYNIDFYLTSLIPRKDSHLLLTLFHKAHFQSFSELHSLFLHTLLFDQEVQYQPFAHEMYF